MDARGGILSESLVCGIGDEDAWFYKVIHPTLRLALEGRNLLQVDIVKSHPINSEMLPITRKNDRIRGKADYAFSFHRGNVHASELYDRFHLAGLGYRISHVTDAYTGQVALFSGIEVREENGGKNEALVQLAVWLSAGLENVRRLGEMGHKRKYLGEELRPMVGWTIIGHDWHTCIASRADKNGRDVCVSLTTEATTYFLANIVLNRTLWGHGVLPLRTQGMCSVFSRYCD
ncbi:hypothetical protein IQ07DRAFT_207317 [Pyrenochaeta sp. DS3sAY3a]|nr:hypothetical protein IQ07DRAFT_207317 [Pyrenochaeta sp. DS3sAY3a]